MDIKISTKCETEPNNNSSQNATIYCFNDFYEKNKDDCAFMSFLNPENEPGEHKNIVKDFVSGAFKIELTRIDSKIIYDINFKRVKTLFYIYKFNRKKYVDNVGKTLLRVIDIVSENDERGPAMNFNNKRKVIDITPSNNSDATINSANTSEKGNTEIKPAKRQMIHILPNINSRNNKMELLLTASAPIKGTYNEIYNHVLTAKSFDNLKFTEKKLFIHRIMSICVDPNNALLTTFELYEWVKIAPPITVEQYKRIFNILHILPSYLDRLISCNFKNKSNIIFKFVQFEMDSYLRNIWILIAIKNTSSKINEIFIALQKILSDTYPMNSKNAVQIYLSSNY